MGPITLDMDDVLRRFDRMCDIFSEIGELTERQVQIVESEGEVDDLLSVVARKTALMNEFETVGKGLAEFKRVWRDERNALLPGRRDAVERRLATLAMLMANVLLLEDRCEADLDGPEEADAPAPGPFARVPYADATAGAPSRIDHHG